jgi:Protein of unknown function (DUF3048) N-terminal domain/Protein of unknown function (DUF3048) C-terminal domain
VTTRTKAFIGGGVALALIAGGAFFIFTNKDLDDVPVLGSFVEPAKCPLTGLEPKNEKVVERPAVALKIENNIAAYPLTGLEDADVVYEEVVEGGLTRFLAIYHCGDARKAGPVRSARTIDPGIMVPYTRILAAAGGNDAVLAELENADVVIIDESSAGDAMSRAERPGISSEHTLYGDTTALRKLGSKRYKDAPSDDLFEFGDLEGKSKKVTSVTVNMSSTIVRYEWNGEQWRRIDHDAPLAMESGTEIAVDNVLLEQHTVNLSDTLGDVIGSASTEIADVTGQGKAVLFRDGRQIVGRWTRDSIEDPVVFETKAGDAMVLAEGTTWIELVPDDQGDVKGSFTVEK